MSAQRLFGVLFILLKGDGEMKQSLKEQLKRWKKDHMEMKEERKRKNKPVQRKTKVDKLSESDLRYLMGTNMQTLKRGKGGAYK